MATTDKDVNGHQEKVESGIQPHGEHLEGEPDPKEAIEVILKSSLDDLSLWTTVKRFRKVGRCSTRTNKIADLEYQGCDYL